MNLGAFSVSLNVQDLEKSKAFYESMGFTEIHAGKDYYILGNESVNIGIFYGMFEGSILTFNPGMDTTGAPVADFTDIRDIRARLVDAGIELTTDLDPDGTGPAEIALTDPDGNAILIDQFFPRPGTAGPAD